MKKIIAAAGMTAAVVATGAVPADAAAPDGFGPWADYVVAAQQGTTLEGAPVVADRSDPSQALGAAEQIDGPQSGTFYSLGFGGSLTVGFDNNICNVGGPDASLSIAENTYKYTPAAYPEVAEVEFSADGTTWFSAGQYTADAEVSMPEQLAVARFVRITDRSDRDFFLSKKRTGADGYDVDGVRAASTNCSTEGRMHGEGKSKTGSQVKDEFKLYCDPADARKNKIEVQFQLGRKQEKFEARAADIAPLVCSDDPSIDPHDKDALIDTVQGKARGSVKNQNGYVLTFRFQDAGRNGHDSSDVADFTLTDPSGQVVATSAGVVSNNTAHD